MLKNNFRTAFRNITRHKSFSFFNIAGLTLGLAACILIGLFVWDEHQYDRFLPGGEQVYRVYDEYTNNEGTQQLAISPPMFTTSLQQDFPEVEKTARVMMLPENKTLFEAGKNKLYQSSGYYVDSTFFDVFPLPFKYGSARNALDDPSSIILSNEMARKFFGNADPVGKQMLMDKEPVQVKGVYVKNPRFHLQFNYIRSVSALKLPPERMQSWGWHQFYSYVKLKKGTNVQALQTKFQKYVMAKSKASRKDSYISDKPIFQPLEKIHLYSSNLKFDAARRGNISYVNALTIIAIFILLIACFNFINLATAKSLHRAKEVGVRKAIGAGKKQLIFQFISETLLLAFVSMIISVMLSVLLLPWENEFTNKHISFAMFVNPGFILLLIAITFVVGILAGFYPALVLSNFKAVKVLKGTVATNQE